MVFHNELVAMDMVAKRNRRVNQDCRCAMVGAGAVVVRDLPAHAVAVGNPARIVGWVCACGETVTRGDRAPERFGCLQCEA